MRALVTFLAPRIALAVLGAWFVACALNDNVIAGLPDGPLSGYPLLGGQLAACVLVLARAGAVRGRERWGWALMGAGLVSWWLGDLYWFGAGEEAAPIPSWGDAGYLACIPLMLAGVGALASTQLRRTPRAL